jgi:hypothetical protein
MPPCAQTLCDRFTGVRLMQSTATPSSASFMVAANPASPPPTTSTRCFANVSSYSRTISRKGAKEELCVEHHISLRLCAFA